MTRPAHARAAVLAAAEAIVQEIGAANLTYDELVRRSGITRGGITYHFPTKDSLLQALVEHDLSQWRACVAAKREHTRGPTAELAAYIESATEPDDDTTRLCAGLMSAVSTSRGLMSPWQAYYAEQHAALARTAPDPVQAAILMLAADGLFWQETLGLSPFTPAERQAVAHRLRALAAGRADAGSPPGAPDDAAACTRGPVAATSPGPKADRAPAGPSRRTRRQP